MSKIFRQGSVEESGTQTHKLDEFGRVLVGQIGELGDNMVGDEVVDIERRAYEEGFSVGEKAGFELGTQKAAFFFNGISLFLDEVSNYKESMFKACEEEMLELVLAVSRKVIHKEVELSNDVVVECVRAAMKMIVAGQDITVKVNAKDLDIMHEYRPELSRYMKGERGLVIESDNSIERGGAKVESNFGEIDASIDGVLEEIEKVLRDAQ